MDTKSELLALLKHSGKEYISGEKAAEKLGISRAAVWKAVQGLQNQGLAVESVRGKGYRLTQTPDLFTKEALRLYIKDKNIPIMVLDEVNSTNTEAKKWALDGAPHGAVIVSKKQTGGRGRLGRTFESPPGGLYISVILRLPNKTSAGLITSAAAVAVRRAVADTCRIALDIKWVNDLYLNGKKCCGILSEAGTGVETGEIEYIVVGIGLNYTTAMDAFPKDVANIVTSLYPDSDAQVPRMELVGTIYNHLISLCEGLPSTDFLDEYRAANFVLGKKVNVMSGSPYEAQAIEIDDEAGLVVEKGDGTKCTLSYGEISIKL